MYGKEGDIGVKLINRGPPVLIRSIDVLFPADGTLAPYVEHLAVHERLASYASDVYQIQIRANLRLPSGTQTFKFRIQAEMDGVEHVVTIDPVNHIEFRHRPGASSIFVSHKISEDTPIADDLGRFLLRAGFQAYLAENDKRPGVDLRDKIRPRIDDAYVVAILWTKRRRAARS